MDWMATTMDEQHAPATVLPEALFRKKGVLLIDDDPAFRALFLAVAGALGIPGRAYASLSEMNSFAELRNYDVVVLDYYLESFKGPEIAEYIDVFFTELPVIMISGGDVDEQANRVWPSCIQRFLKKSAGPYEILQAAIMALKRAEAI